VRPISTTVALGLCLLTCSTQPSVPRGPAPEYEPPVLPPWDAGSGADSVDPFAAAAEGDWISEPPEDPPSDSPGVQPQGDADAAADSVVAPSAADGGQVPALGSADAGAADQEPEK